MQHKSKYQSRTHAVMGVSLLLVLMLAVTAQASTFTAPKKLADYLYYMEYTDYVPNPTTGEQVKNGLRMLCRAQRKFLRTQFGS